MEAISMSYAASQIIKFHSGAIPLKYEELETYSKVMRIAESSREARFNELLWIDLSGKSVNLGTLQEIDLHNMDIIPGTVTRKGKAVLMLFNDLKNL